MKKITLFINEDPSNIKMTLTFILDSLNVLISERKNIESPWHEVFNKKITISKEIDINIELEKIYREYLEKKDIENYWTSTLEGARVFQIQEVELIQGENDPDI